MCGKKEMKTNVNMEEKDIGRNVDIKREGRRTKECRKDRKKEEEEMRRKNYLHGRKEREGRREK